MSSRKSVALIQAAPPARTNLPVGPIPTSIAIFACLTVGTIFSAWLTFAATRIELSYLNNYGFFCDPSAYYVQNIHLFRFFQDHGTWPAVFHELQFNPRHPLRTVPYLIFAPNLLTTITGHLWTQTPFLWSFLTLFSWVAFLRTRSLLFAVASASVFLGFPFLYDPAVGLGAYWLDFTAACALCSAALCLIAYVETKRAWWIIGFGAFAAATALSRWSSAFYLLAFAAVAVPLALATVCGRDWRRLLAALGCLVLAASPGIIFTIAFLGLNRQHYQTFGFAFGAPLSQSIEWTVSAITRMIGSPLLALIGLFIAVNLYCLASARRLAVPTIAMWLPVSLFLFVCFVVKAVNGTHPLVYFGPALLIAAFIPVQPIPAHRIWWRMVCLLLLGASLWCAPRAYDLSRRLANNPPDHSKLAKQCDAALADLIIATGSRSLLQINDETVNPHLEAFFRSGKICSSLPIFSRNEAYLKGMYPGQNIQTMTETVYDKTKSSSELVAVFANPADATKKGVFPNDYSRALAVAISSRIARDNDFELLTCVQSPTGLLSVYQNKKLRAHPRPIY